jgi:hypothetical protein
MWEQLEMVHEATGAASVISALRVLFRTIADEGTNLEEHLTEIRRTQDQLMVMQAEIPDWIYTTIMLTSLPPSWDSFTTGFMGQNTEKSLKIPSRKMESILRDEYRRRTHGPAGQIMAAQSTGNNRGVRPKSDIQCFNCKRKGHTKDQCWRKGGGAYGQGPKQQGKEKKQQANQAEQEGGDAFGMAFNLIAKGEVSTTSSIANASSNKIPFTRYDWLMDSGASIHIATERAMFKTYEPYKEALDIPGSQSVTSHGRGTVELDCPVNGKTITHTLVNVLHIPTNRNCLFSESRFDEAGGGFIVWKGMRRLINRDKRVVGEAKLTPEHMYKLIGKARLHMAAANAIEKKKVDWNEWHRRYGHIAISALEKLKKNSLVMGLDVDTSSVPSTCEACIVSKITTRPFPKEAKS